jgi:ubiquinone/menaquinone biosynthesis C-methylase UbiE
MSKINCPVCANTKISLKKDFSMILNLPGNSESRVFYCKTCRALFLYPLPDSKKLYSDSYFSANHTSIEHFPTTGLDYEEEIATKRHEKFRRTIKELILMHPSAQCVLDIGAATGDFLNIAKEFNLDVYGIEISDYAVKRAKEKFGIKLVSGQLEDYETEKKFDLVHLNHVLEHFCKPKSAIEKLSKLTKKNGIVYVEVPFQFNIVEKLKYRLLKKTYDFNVSSLHHPFFFTPETLCSYFVDAGFSVQKLSFFNPTTYLANSISKRLRKLVWYLLANVKQGLIIEGYFRKI